MKFCPECGEPRLSEVRRGRHVVAGDCYDCAHCGLGINVFVYQPAGVPV